MSNGDTYVDVRSEQDYHLGLALDLCLNYHSGGDRLHRITHSIEHDNAIYFGWHANSGGECLTGDPEVGLSKETLMTLINDWLKTADYGEEDDIDGSVERGWRVISHLELMPDISGRFYLTFGVQPCYMYYSK